MIIERVFTPGLAQVAYLVADEQAGQAIVIDPRRDILAYLDWLAVRHLRLAGILETHVHADFVSGAPELAAATGAPVYASRIGRSEFPHIPLDDGDLVPFGNLALQAFWTPGHTPEHMSYLLIDTERGPDPVALFSGDLLFVGEVGRPDLLGESHTTELAGQLHETIQHRLAPLGDDVVVYPGHTAGSACGRKIGDAPHTTLGLERLTNYAFQPRSREEFVETVLKGMPPAPTYYPVLKRVNKAGAPFLSTLKQPQPISPADVLTMMADGAIAIDTRSPEAFATGHLPGSRFAGLGANFTAWTGWMAPYDRPIILIVEHAAMLDEAMVELHRIGLDNVAGYLDGGVAAWQTAGLPIATIDEMPVGDLASRLDDTSLAILDVRGADEFESGHIPGAVNVFAGRLVQGEDVPFAPNDEVAIICGTGYRSLVAASELAARGFQRIINIPGGMTAWTDAGLPAISDVESLAPA